MAIHANKLSLLAPLPNVSRPLDGEWRMTSSHNGDGLERGYADPAFDDSSWTPTRLPSLHYATAERDTLWYRCHFVGDLSGLRDLTGLERIILRFGGAFYRTRVWLNGVELGAHEGYFQPFGFDVTDYLQDGDNVLAVRCRFPVEAGSFKRKTAVAGIFADWDCKPYPSTFYPHLPAPNEWTVPIGIWQPVSLHATGPVLVESFNIFPTVINPDWQSAHAEAATLKVVADVRNLAADSQCAELELNIAPHNFVERDVISLHNQSLKLAGSEHRTLDFNLTLPRPRLWFPWTHGEPCLYKARLQISNLQPPISNLQSPVSKTFGIRAVEAVIGHERWEWRLNGRRIFPKGSNYVSDFYLDRVTVEGLRRDLELAREANLDLLRAHAHIAPTDFYRLCDEQGLMVMCDFPLIWTYAFNLPPEEEAAFRAAVHEQVADMTGLLASHPSIILWSMHNEPPWTPDGSFLGSEVHQTGTNRQMDEASANLTGALDPTRPVIAASGERDQHLYHGWYTGHWQDNRQLRPTFPTEFGVQALPNLASPFWATVNTNWPVDADDPSWAHAGYQSLFWAGPGVGPPSHFESLADYVAESQAYQAFFIRYTIDQWRRQKFQPVGGYIHFLFTDGWPAITWSVLDYYRLPKAGYRALAEASRPVHLSLDVEPGFTVEGGFHLAYRLGERLVVGLYLINDDYRLAGLVTVRWWIERRDRRRFNRIRKWLAKRIRAALPGAESGAAFVQSIELPLTGAGDYALNVEAVQDGRVLTANRLEFRVGAERRRTKPSRRVPGLLVNKVYQAGSLRHTEDGFTFSLRNPVMPVILQGLAGLRVDGQSIEVSQVEFVYGGLSRRASTITPQAPLDIPSNVQFAVVVRQRSLAPGEHELELTADFAGLGEISAKVRDKLV
jgi:beta-mannosidase